MFSRPVSSGWKPVPTSSRLATRPVIVDAARGRLGDAATGSSAASLLPAPLRPMMPTTSPRLTSKLTSLSAQNSSVVVAGDDRPSAQHVAAARQRCARRARSRRAAPRSARARPRWPITIFLAEALGADDDVARSISDQIGEGALGRAEIATPSHRKSATTTRLASEARQVERALAAEQAPAEAVDHADQRVEAVPEAATSAGTTELEKPTGET